MRLLAVLGASAALGRPPAPAPRALARADRPDARLHPPAGVRRPRLAARAVGADPEDPHPLAGAAGPEAVDALRVEYRRLLLRLAARDLAHDLGVDDVAAELADLAAGTLEAALAIARARVGEAATVGPAGGHRDGQVRRPRAQLRQRRRRHLRRRAGRRRRRARAAARAATQLASPMMRICSDHTAEGTIWPVDAALRPEGKAGPAGAHPGQPPRLLRALGEDLGVPGPAQGPAGRRRPGPRPGVRRAWSRRWCGRRPSATGFVGDVQAMRRRVVEHIPRSEAERQLKLGLRRAARRRVRRPAAAARARPRRPEPAQAPTTLSALGRADRGRLRRARGRRGHARGLPRSCARLEHRHPAVPAAPHPRRARRTTTALRRLGRSLGLPQGPGRRARERQWRQHRREVRRLHEKLFYRPLLSAVARIPGDEVRLTTEAATARLDALGYADPAAALRHLEALTAGVSRTRGDPAHPAAGDARVVRRRPRPGRRAARLPADQRRARQHPLVPRDAARRGRGRRAAGPAAGHQPLRHRPAAARAAGRAGARRRPDAAVRASR